jgi:hypothetical protein
VLGALKQIPEDCTGYMLLGARCVNY